MAHTAHSTLLGQTQRAPSRGAFLRPGWRSRWALRPERALLNDINAPLMNFYAWLKKGLLNARLDMRNDADTYYATGSGSMRFS